MSLSLEIVQQEVGRLMNNILGYFKPGSVITVIVRQANDPEGKMDFMLTNDAPSEALKVITRRMEQAK